MTSIIDETSSLDDDWRALISRLLDDHETLVEDFLLRLSEIGTYAPHDIPATDLRRAASDTLELLIRRLAGLPISAELTAAPTNLGIRRAQQGIPRESLMDAVRLDFRVLWGGLVRAGGPAAADLLVRHAEEVLSTVEQYIGDVQSAFLDEQAALANDSRATVSRALRRLLNAGDDAHALFSETADALRVHLDATLEIVHVPTSSAERARRLTHAAYRERQCARVDLEDGTLFVRSAANGAPLSATLAALSGGLIPSVRGLAELRPAATLAQRIAQHAPIGRLVTERDVWLPLVRDAVIADLPSIGQALEGLEAVSPSDRERLAETVVRYCATGSIKQTAADLYCHRNTVVNRLQQFAELTGSDVTVPIEAARVLIALGAATAP